MIRILLIFILIFSLAGFSFAAKQDRLVIFKYLNNGAYETYIDYAHNFRQNRSVITSISRNLLNGHFSLEAIPEEYYTVKKLENIDYFGFKLTQYTIIPKDKERFKYVYWVDVNDKDRMVKLEVYDIVDGLMFAFSGFDYVNGAIFKGKHKHDSRKYNNQNERFEEQVNSEITNEKQMQDDIKKYKFRKSINFYKGFRHFNTNIMTENNIDLSFEDGVNKFSIFIKPATISAEPVNTVLYGNYLYSRIIGNIEYTVYGTISFGLMEEVVNIISENINIIIEEAVKGNILTQDIYLNK